MSATLEHLPIASVSPAEDNIRRHVEADDELVASVRSLGIIEPLIVTNGHPDTYVVVAGHRRLEAARAAGLPEVPAIVKDLDERGRLEYMLVENTRRRSLSALEEAEAFRRLTQLKVTQRKIAERVGCGQAHISRRLALLKLPERAQEALDSGGINIAQGEALARLAEHPKRVEKVLKRLDAEGEGFDLDWGIRRELADLEREQAREKVIAELEAAGVAVVEHPGNGNWLNRPERPLSGQEEGIWDRPQLDIAVADHAGEPCHGAAVDRQGVVVHVCLAPDRHEGDGDAPAAEAEARRQREPAARARPKEAEEDRRRAELHHKLAAAAQARGECFGRLLAKRKFSKPAVTEYLLARAVFVEEDAYVEVADAAELLGIEVADPTILDWKVLEDLALISGDELVRVAMALSFLRDEAGLFDFSDWSGNEAIHRHFAFLMAHGYELADVERDKLGLAPGQKPGTAS
jgi:ParB/RepB/Spo0J family partition protein